MSSLNKIILHPDFHKTLEELKRHDIFLPKEGAEEKPLVLLRSEGDLKLTNLEDIRPVDLNCERGCAASNNYTYSAYDESIQKYQALEGAAYFTAHSLVVVGEKEYIPVALVTFNFYTRSKSITASSNYIKYAEDPAVEFDRDYMRDKVRFLLENTPERSLLLVDGPLIGGNLYTIMLDANDVFLSRDIVPIFFVKNSGSNLVTDRIDRLRGNYNSDMHWLNSFLKRGERSNFFKYEDQVNSKNTMAFCYVKAFESSPVRVEMHTKTYYTYQSSIEKIMDLVYYLFLVQGSSVNPQIRPVAVAEKYARAILKFIDINKYFKEAKITPTINQVRFGGDI